MVKDALDRAHPESLKKSFMNAKGEYIGTASVEVGASIPRQDAPQTPPLGKRSRSPQPRGAVRESRAWNADAFAHAPRGTRSRSPTPLLRRRSPTPLLETRGRAPLPWRRSPTPLLETRGRSPTLFA